MLSSSPGKDKEFCANVQPGRAVLNVCFPYTSRDEITTAIRSTVSDFSKPSVEPIPQRPFSASHIEQTLKARQASSKPETRSESPHSDTSSTTLHPEVESPPSHKSLPDPETITAQTLDDNMFTAGNPPLDLLVRTSGVERLSDFMLWQCHEKTEVVFLDCLWPEFDLWQFLPVLVEWQWRQRKDRMSEDQLSSLTI
jgi:ditrans,polycis-polyprenyl diphosphate synthase